MKHRDLTIGEYCRVTLRYNMTKMTTTPYDVAEHLVLTKLCQAKKKPNFDIILKIMGALDLRFHAEVA